MSTEILIIVLLLVANGIFAMSEIAIVSSRRARLAHRAEEGDARAAAALRLKDKPTAFLSTVQVGITLVGILAGAYSGATLTEQLAAWLAGFPAVAEYAEGLALAIVVGAITYGSLIIGELVPKAIALTNPERIAALVAGPVGLLARVATPIVKLLTLTTDLVLTMLRVPKNREAAITEEEIRLLIKQAALAGDVPEVEQRIVEKVFHLGDRRVNAVMTPRHEIEWLDVNLGVDGVREYLKTTRHPRLVFCDGDLDHVVGVAYVEDLLAAALDNQASNIRATLRPPVYVPDSISVFELVETFRREHMHVAMVLDEFGAIEGIVTSTDILEGLVGEIPSHPGDDEPGPVVRREDGSLLLDGMLSLDDLAVEVELPDIPETEVGHYHTLAGLVMTRLGRVPREGDSVTWGDWSFEVVDMDGRRIDKVIMKRVEG